MDRVGDALRLIAYIIKNPDISLPDIEALSSEALASKLPDEEYIPAPAAISKVISTATMSGGRHRHPVTASDSTYRARSHSRLRLPR